MLTMEQPARTMNVEEPQPEVHFAMEGCVLVPRRGARPWPESTAAASRQERSSGELTRQPVGQRDGTCERAQQPAGQRSSRLARREDESNGARERSQRKRGGRTSAAAHASEQRE